MAIDLSSAKKIDIKLAAARPAISHQYNSVLNLG